MVPIFIFIFSVDPNKRLNTEFDKAAKSNEGRGWASISGISSVALKLSKKLVSTAGTTANG